ncbi:MAG: hypothetical protein ACOCUI_04950 [bacterium]
MVFLPDINVCPECGGEGMILKISGKYQIICESCGFYVSSPERKTAIKEWNQKQKEMNTAEEQKMDKDQFVKLLGQLSNEEIKMILKDLKKHHADQMFIDCCLLELSRD